MANVFTALQPTLFSAAKEVAAEPFGIIDSINANFDDKEVAKGDTVTVPVAPVRAAQDFVPGATNPIGDDATAEGVAVQITASRKVSWNLTGEQLKSLQNANSDKDWVKQLVAQGMRTLRNEAEVDAATAVKQGASRAVGTAGTTPFASDLSVLTASRKVLRDNGAPMSDLQFVFNTDSELNLLNLGIIQQAYAAGSDEERRTANLKRQFGFKMTASAGIAQHVKGTGASYVTSGATAKGVRDVALVTGTGTVLSGDVVTFAADSANKYVVNNGIASPGTIKLGAPGARVLIPTANALTIGNSYTPNLAFERNAVVGIMRPPAFPANATINRTLISDAYGMTYLLLQLEQYGMTSWELHLAWGFKAVNTEFIAIAMG